MATSLSLNRTRKVPAEDTAAFGAIAERFRRGGALERAVSLCREGLQKFPDHVSARVTLGWSLLDLGKYDEARLELEQVLRRAPDNLAAIRGLAELHDRFEHTLNLPMDGPGQWPPPPEATDHIADDPIAASPLAFVAGESDAGDVEFAPAELGIPIWSPATAAATADPVVEIDPEPEVVVYASPAPVAPPVAAVSAPGPVPAPASAPPPMMAAASPAAAVGAGMSSVREIEMSPASGWAGISAAPSAESASVEIEQAEGAVAFAGGDSAEADDAEIAALIAEAESLESAADFSTPVAADALADFSMEPAGTLDVEDPALELSVATDASDDVDLPLVIGTVTPQFDDAVEAEDAGELIVQAGSTDSAAPSAEVALAEPQMEFGVEAPAAVEPAGQDDDVELAQGVAPIVDAGPSFELTPFAPSDVMASDEPSAVEPVAAAFDESMAPVLPFHVAQVHPALPALERLLAQVQNRRSQLMAQSVA